MRENNSMDDSKKTIMNELKNFFIAKGTIEYVDSELKKISTQAKELELDWKLGDLSKDALEQELEKLNLKFEKLKELKNTANKTLKENYIPEKYLQELENNTKKLDKLNELKSKKAISKAAYKEYKKAISQRIKELKKLLREIVQELKHIKRDILNDLKRLNVEKDHIFVAYSISELSQDEYFLHQNEITMKIFIYKNAADLIERYIRKIKEAIK
ncbi:MAG: hypothetical protein ACP6IU_12460 [Candidatus Asgardarchaeia archaeon]